MIQDTLTIQTDGRSTIDITQQINARIDAHKIELGLCHLFLQHTSASLILCENYDPDVRHDLESFTARWVPDGDPLFTHTAEGPDDMPAHIRSIFSHNDLTVPIRNQQLVLGTWQGIFLWEHRHHPHQRTITITITT